ncbi:MAG: flagellar hook-basal body complex protein FliE [Myxococcales bacterium]|nr:flagellar hook-basal body complex protein FliE [Myxococcales bacterium]
MTIPISNLASAQRSEFPIARNEAAHRAEKSGRSDGAESSSGLDFADAITGAIQRAAIDEKQATEMSTQFAEGDPNVGIHEVVIASERANVSLRYAVTLKNKVVEAYRDIMSTQV